MRTADHRPPDHVIVLFGATGDLAKRKLLPGLYHLALDNLMPERFAIIGSAPAAQAISTEAFAAHAKDAISQFGRAKPEGEVWERFEKALSFGAADPGDPGPLLGAIADARAEVGQAPLLFHLAIPPVAFGSVVKMLGDAQLAEGSRVIVEKPFGTDYASAHALNETIHTVFEERQIFRIDHFLGKESIDNILALRFANGLFEPVWNREHVRYVQIDVPETLTIEGRAGFYEATGAYRDMVVTHLFQVLGFVAMEPPAAIDQEHLRSGRSAVFQALKPLDCHQVVRGQYDGYRQEQGVAPDSSTETMVALRAEVDNDRWRGVPFFLRSGKAMAQSRQVLTLGFVQPSLALFPDTAQAKSADCHNELVIDFADPGSISARFLAKEPGPGLRLGEATMTFEFSSVFDPNQELEGYERLLHDAMDGDQSLFTSADGIERLWQVSAPLLEHPPGVEPYPVGSWGPASVAALTAPYRWHLGD